MDNICGGDAVITCARNMMNFTWFNQCFSNRQPFKFIIGFTGGFWYCVFKDIILRKVYNFYANVVALCIVIR